MVVKKANTGKSYGANRVVGNNSGYVEMFTQNQIWFCRYYTDNTTFRGMLKNIVVNTQQNKVVST